MALPPRPMGSLVDPSLMPLDVTGEQTEVDVPEPMDFAMGAEIIPNEDGSVTIEELLEEAMGDEIPEDIPHDANLAEYLDDGYLGELSSELRASYEDDLESRSDWEETYTKGLDQLGIKQEDRTQPFEGASGVTHPLIVESVTQFQAQAYKELLPAGGPVQTQILGKQDANVEAQANRVKDYLNYQIT